MLKTIEVYEPVTTPEMVQQEIKQYEEMFSKMTNDELDAWIDEHARAGDYDNPYYMMAWDESKRRMFSKMTNDELDAWIDGHARAGDYNNPYYTMAWNESQRRKLATKEEVNELAKQEMEFWEKTLKKFPDCLLTKLLAGKNEDEKNPILTLTARELQRRKT